MVSSLEMKSFVCGLGAGDVFADAVENGLDVRSFVQRLIVAEIVAGA